MRELRQKAYNSTQWRKVRLEYIMNHPVCEECLKHGRINAGGKDNPLQVHHLQSPFKHGEIDYNLLLDSNNLMTLCPECHNAMHNKNGITAEEVLRQLDELFADED